MAHQPPHESLSPSPPHHNEASPIPNTNATQTRLSGSRRLKDGPTSWVVMVLSVIAICAPLYGLSQLGNTLESERAAAESVDSIHVEGDQHQLTFSPASRCVEHGDDPSSPTYFCEQNGKDVSITVRAQPTIDDVDIAARRGVRELTQMRDITQFETTTQDEQDHKVVIATGTDADGNIAQSVAIQPSGDSGGFVINVSANADDANDTTLITSVVNQVIDTIDIKKQEESGEGQE